MKYKRFQDIPKFPRANYCVHASWHGLERWLELFANDGETPLVFDPPYQRGYVWSLEQKVSYIEFKLRGGSGGDDIYWNSVGFERGASVPMELVDGKQRITTVLEFKRDEFPIFGDCLFSQFEDGMDMLMPRFQMHVNDLKTELEIVQWYLGMNTGGSIHSAEDLAPALALLEKLSK